MKQLVDIDVIAAQWTPGQLAQAQEATKKKMNLHKILSVVFLFLGIGLFLPFGKLAQLYTLGYKSLCGKRATGAAFWAFLGFFMSLLMVFLGKMFPSIIAARFVYPPDAAH